MERIGLHSVIIGIALSLLLPAAESTSQETEPATMSTDCVILLHGLCRSARSMKKIETSLADAGYDVLNIDYTSTQKSIEEIAAEDVTAAVNWCYDRGYDRVHFVTHSLGGIIVRCYLQGYALPPGSRIVMLAPPNQGSELVDVATAYFPEVYGLAGPAGRELAIAPETLLQRLAPVAEEIGVIAGTRSLNPVFSPLLPGKDDGKVSVQRTKIPEMCDFLEVPDNHFMILYDSHVHEQIIFFLNQGTFKHNRIEPELKTSNPATSTRRE